MTQQLKTYMIQNQDVIYEKVKVILHMLAYNMFVTILILTIAFFIHNWSIICTFEVPNLKIIAFVTLNIKNSSDVVMKYNLLEKISFFRNKNEASYAQQLKNKQIEVMRKIIKFYEGISNVETNARKYFQKFLMVLI